MDPNQVENIDDEDMFEDEEFIEVIDIDEDDENNENNENEVSECLKLTFSKHVKSVFIGTLSSDGKLAATGGEDDTAYVWNAETSEVLFECIGHKESVIEVAFNHSNRYLATADMSGTIQVWQITDKQLVWITDQQEDLCWILWHHTADALFAGFQSGLIYIWKIPEGKCKTLQSFGFGSTCAKLLDDGKRLLSGYEDGVLRLWDLKNSSVLWQTKSISEKGIIAIDVTDDLSLCVVAPSGLLFNVQNGKQVSKMSRKSDQDGDIEVAKFNTKLNFLATGSISGELCLWDFKRGSLRHEKLVGEDISITSLVWGADNTFFIGTSDFCVHHCNAMSGELINSFRGHTGAILSLSISKDNSFILTTSDDGTAKIFSLEQ